MKISTPFKKPAAEIPGIASPTDITRALKSCNIPFIEEIALRVGYHEGDLHPEYHNLQNRIARLKNLAGDIQEIQAGLAPGQECEII